MPVGVRGTLRRVRVRPVEIARLAERILAGSGRAGADLSLLFTGDRRMRRLNRTYRAIDASTDVLAFPAGRPAKGASSLLGDVVISLPQAFRQASAAGISIDQEVVTLLIHGVLHLIGYDHERSVREAQRMRRKERAVLRGVGPVPRLVMR